MATRGTLPLEMALSLKAHNAGLFISRGEGRHGDRVIDTHELIFVRQGGLGMYEETDRFSVGAGQTLLLRPGVRHGGTKDYAADLSFYWIHFEVSGNRRRGAVRRTDRAMRAGMRGARRPGVLVVPRCATVARPDRLAELFHWFLNDQEAGRLTPVAADLLLLLMLHEVTDPRPPDDVADSAGAALAARAEKLIRTRFHEALQTSLLAHELDCNPDYLGRVYRRAYGCTPTEALHRARLKEARALLIESRMNVNQVAGAVGYSDPGYFRRIFHRQQGVSPRAYRRLHARVHINTK